MSAQTLNKFFSLRRLSLAANRTRMWEGFKDMLVRVQGEKLENCECHYCNVRVLSADLGHTLFVECYSRPAGSGSRGIMMNGRPHNMLVTLP